MTITGLATAILFLLIVSVLDYNCRVAKIKLSELKDSYTELHEEWQLLKKSESDLLEQNQKLEDDILRANIKVGILTDAFKNR